jgi:uncharacterized membrane protein
MVTRTLSETTAERVRRVCGVEHPFRQVAASNAWKALGILVVLAAITLLGLLAVLATSDVLRPYTERILNLIGA